MGIRNKLFIGISLTFVMVIGLFIYFSFPRMERIIFAQRSKVMSSVTNQVADALDFWFVERSTILLSIAREMESSELDAGNPELPIFIDSMAERFSNKFNYIYTGFANKVYISTNKTQLPSSFDPTSRLWFKDAIQENSLVVTEPYRDVNTGRFKLSIASPVKTPTPGVIGTSLYLDELHSIVDKANFDPRAQVFLISKTGKLLYTTNQSFGNLGENFADIESGTFQSLAEKMAIAKNGSSQFEWKGTSYYVVFSPINTTGWSVAVSLPMAVFYDENKEFIIHVVIITLIGLLALFLIIYVIIRQVIKPLESISLTARNLSAGDFTVNFKETGTAEVEYLANSLEMMRENIFSLIEKKEILIKETMAQKEEIAALYGQMKALNDELLQANQEEEEAYRQTIKALAEAIETKDNYTGGHSNRVLLYSKKMGTLLGWNQKQLKILRYAAILHDIGKIGVHPDILNKPGRLLPEEFEKIKLHPGLGYRILHNIGYLDSVSKVVLQHHERLDGLGYPCGLKGEEISPFARVIMVADTYDAMTSHRPYRKALSAEEACQELRRCSGTQFDSKIVELFCDKILPELEHAEQD